MQISPAPRSPVSAPVPAPAPGPTAPAPWAGDRYGPSAARPAEAPAGAPQSLWVQIQAVVRHAWRTLLQTLGMAATPPSQSSEDAAFVTELYRRFLGREPDPAGLQAHLAGLAHGTSRAQLEQIFWQSDEYRQRQAAAVQARGATPAPQPIVPPVAPSSPPQPAPPAPVPAPPLRPAELTSEEKAIATAVGIPATRGDFDMYVDEMGAVHDQNALGPGCVQPRYVSELQQLLASYGYQVAVTGAFDAATTAAVLKYKRDHGSPFSLWHSADGSIGVHPFIDEATKAALLNTLCDRLGPAAGHWDELGIFRPSPQVAAAVAQYNNWVYDQPMRDGDPNFDPRVTQAKLATGFFIGYTRADGRVVPLVRAAARQG